MMLLAALVLAAGQDDPMLRVDLPAGTVAAGLDRLARQAGQALVARPADLAGRQAPALKGVLRLSRALDRWCRPAGLSCRRMPGGIVVRAGRSLPPKVTPPRRAASPPPPPVVGEEVIVSGRRGTDVQGELDRSYSASHLDAVELARRPPQSLAEMLSGLPGLWVDTSAGTAANTVRVRGIPLDGYQAIAVQEDGLPVQHDTLPWTDIDQFVRPDLMVETVDYVRGGPSAIFASNAPGGVLNMRTRAPAGRPGGEMRATLTDYGLVRWEGYATGPVAPGWRAIIGGSVARDPTVRRIAATLGGGQIRARVDHDWRGGRLTLAWRGLADDTLNISSFPMRYVGGRLEPMPGFDPRRDSFFRPRVGDPALRRAGRAAAGAEQSQPAGHALAGADAGGGRRHADPSRAWPDLADRALCAFLVGQRGSGGKRRGRRAAPPRRRLSGHRLSRSAPCERRQPLCRHSRQRPGRDAEPRRRRRPPVRSDRRPVLFARAGGGGASRSDAGAVRRRL
nr:TonB-dependent receptor plug domain-containing protein [Sphingomonas sp. SORGH_AS_0870]